MKKILILGVGHSQRDLAIAAKQYGARVYACAKSEDGAAMEFVDEFRKIDILNVDEVEAFAREASVDAVYTVALEAAIGTVAQVSERLGLRTFVSSSDMDRLENKGAWRKALGNIYGNLPFSTARSLDEAKDWSIFPAIMKPVDSSGQRGVIKINNEQELKEEFTRSKSFSRSGTIILEEYAQGEEISVNAFMYKGELVFSVISDRLSYKDLPGGIIREHHVPSKYDTPKLSEKIHDLVLNVNKVMNFDNGHVYFQIKVQGDDVSLIEFTPRFDGCHMWHLIKFAYGLDLLKISLECLLEGQSLTLESFTKKEPEARYILKFISDQPGTVVDYSNYSLDDNIVYHYWYYNEGAKVRTITGILEKVGYYIYTSKLI